MHCIGVKIRTTGREAQACQQHPAQQAYLWRIDAAADPLSCRMILMFSPPACATIGLRSPNLHTAFMGDSNLDTMKSLNSFIFRTAQFSNTLTFTPSLISANDTVFPWTLERSSISISVFPGGMTTMLQSWDVCNHASRIPREGQTGMPNSIDRLS